MSYERVWPMFKTLRFELEREIPPDGISIPEREALIFAETLRRIPVGSSNSFGIFGEMGMGFVPQGERAAWERRIKDFESAPKSADADPFQQRPFGLQPGDGGRAHTIIDYGFVIAHGLKGVDSRIEKELPGSSKAKREMLSGMKVSLNALAEFARRYSTELRVPWEPASSFAEGLQCLWLLNIGIAFSEQAPWSISLGRFDQYMLKLYRSDIAKGVPEAELEAQLADFFKMLDNPEFADAAMALNLGGRDSSGKSLFNDLSRMIVKVAKRLRLPAPLLTARIDDSLSQADFDMLCAPELLTIGQPTFYGEDSCRKALAVRGVPSAEIPNWAVNSCMGVMMPGQEWSDMWGSVLVVTLSLELALNGGRPFKGALPFKLKTEHSNAYGSFEELFEKVCDYADEIIELLIVESERRRELRLPNPFVSALLDDCITKGLDKLHGGARYRTLIVEPMGLVNCADALLAIRKLAFDAKEFPLGTLAEAAKCDYEGAEGILQRIKTLPKYGNADPEADDMASKLASRIAKSVMRHSTPEVACAPSFHTLTGHIDRGAKTAASLDGRRSGEPLAKNVGTRHGLAAKGHTSLVLSATAIDQAAFFGGQALDLSFDPSILRTKDGKRKFQSLLKTYFQRGGLQVQVNGLSPDTLRKAMAEPDNHKDLIVRIGGFSLRFTGMSEGAQKDFIARFETGV